MYTNTQSIWLMSNRYLKSRSANDAHEAQSALVAYPKIDKRGASLLDAVLQRDPTTRPTADGLMQLLHGVVGEE